MKFGLKLFGLKFTIKIWISKTWFTRKGLNKFFVKKNFTVITHKNSLSILMLDIFLFKE